MSQRNVERLIGRLLTDEDFRDQFQVSPAQALARLVEGGWELTHTEREALANVDREFVDALAHRMDPRIRKVSLNAEPAGPASPRGNGKEETR
jgi:putative modified peptide